MIQAIIHAREGMASWICLRNQAPAPRFFRVKQVLMRCKANTDWRRGFFTDLFGADFNLESSFLPK